MKKAIFSLMLAISFSCLAEVIEINETIAYSGAISGNNIFLTLSFKGEEVVGDYFYEKYKVPIALHGKLSGSELLLIEKTIKGEAYIGAEKKGGFISGAWSLNGRVHEVYVQALSKSYRDIVNEVKVLKQEGLVRTLLISFKNGAEQNIDVSVLEDEVLVIFEDFTFDGYPDMRVLELEAGGNSSFLYFDYDVSAGRYVSSSSEINDLVSPRIVHSKKAIISISRDGCCIYQAKKILPKELHFATYDFDSRSGYVNIINRVSGGVAKKPISEKQFEDDYLIFMSPVGSE